MPSTYQYLKRLADAGCFVTITKSDRGRGYTVTIENGPWTPRNMPVLEAEACALTLRSAVQAAFLQWKGKKQ